MTGAYGSRRGFLQGISAGLLVPAWLVRERAAATEATYPSRLNVRQAGARADGKTIDSTAINKAIEQVAARGGGVVHFPAGTYACHTIRLKSGGFTLS
jgi:polygalacturonase